MTVPSTERETSASNTLAPPSKNERLKVVSDGLAGTLPVEVADAAIDHLSGDATQLLKFHGSYQQDDRDARAERRREKRDRAWQFMVRTKTPGGRLTNEQYLLADELASRFGNETLRITTRQGIQFHGIGKANLKPLIRTLNERWVTTYGACGDIARNTLTCPVADLLPGSRFDMQTLAREISDRFLPESTAYYELWLDGEKFLTDGSRVKVKPTRTESFYGPTYMPRKHKMGIGLPHDNCIDLFTQDLALEAVLDTDGELRGYNLVAGGGLGSTHGQSATFPRLGDRIGFLPPEQAIPVLEAASAVYRDYGDRSNRRHARLKYVLEDRGVVWFQEQVAAQLGAPLAPPADVGEYGVNDHLGWQQQADGRWLIGVWIENGRVEDRPGRTARTGLRTIVEQTGAEVRLTAQQNIILTNIPADARAAVEALLVEHGLSSGNGMLSPLRRYAMACPALPTCGLAVAEAERYLPDVIGALEQRGYGDERVWIRMSGCPNSCSRPPTAEIGIIGRSLGLYDVYIGGSFAGTRLTRPYRADVKSADLVDVLADVIDVWRRDRRDGEEFGDFCHRVGVEQLQQGVAAAAH